MPDLIVPIAGDSNAGHGSAWISSDDNTVSNILMLDNTTVGGTPSTILATETALDGTGSKGNASMGGNTVGSALALVKLLVARGYKPPGYTNVILVGGAAAGTAFLNEWATTGSRTALNAFESYVDAALGLTSGNRIWFYNWDHGENDGGQTQAQYQNNMIATWGEIRARYGSNGGLYAPILVSGCPPDRQDSDLGRQVNMGGPIAAQQNIANVLQNAIYIDPTGLNSDFEQGFVHFSAASQRGGADNSSLTNASRTSGSYLWNAGDTFTTGAQATDLAVDDQDSDWVYRYIGASPSSSTSRPHTDATNWRKTNYQYGKTVTDPLSEKKFRAIISAPYQMDAAWS